MQEKIISQVRKHLYFTPISYTRFKQILLLAIQFFPDYANAELMEAEFDRLFERYNTPEQHTQGMLSNAVVHRLLDTPAFHDALFHSTKPQAVEPNEDILKRNKDYIENHPANRGLASIHHDKLIDKLNSMEGNYYCFVYINQPPHGLKPHVLVKRSGEQVKDFILDDDKLGQHMSVSSIIAGCEPVRSQAKSALLQGDVFYEISPADAEHLLLNKQMNTQLFHTFKGKYYHAITRKGFPPLSTPIDIYDFSALFENKDYQTIVPNGKCFHQYYIYPQLKFLAEEDDALSYTHFASLSSDERNEVIRVGSTDFNESMLRFVKNKLFTSLLIKALKTNPLLLVTLFNGEIDFLHRELFPLAAFGKTQGPALLAKLMEINPDLVKNSTFINAFDYLILAQEEPHFLYLLLLQLPATFGEANNPSSKLLTKFVLAFVNKGHKATINDTEVEQNLIGLLASLILRNPNLLINICRAYIDSDTDPHKRIARIKQLWLGWQYVMAFQLNAYSTLPTKLNQQICELICNAIVHTPPGKAQRGEQDLNQLRMQLISFGCSFGADTSETRVLEKFKQDTERSAESIELHFEPHNYNPESSDTFWWDSLDAKNIEQTAYWKKKFLDVILEDIHAPYIDMRDRDTMHQVVKELFKKAHPSVVDWLEFASPACLRIGRFIPEKDKGGRTVCHVLTLDFYVCPAPTLQSVTSLAHYNHMDPTPDSILRQHMSNPKNWKLKSSKIMLGEQGIFFDNDDVIYNSLTQLIRSNTDRFKLPITAAYPILEATSSNTNDHNNHKSYVEAQERGPDKVLINLPTFSSYDAFLQFYQKNILTIPFEQRSVALYQGLSHFLQESSDSTLKTQLSSLIKFYVNALTLDKDQFVFDSYWADKISALRLIYNNFASTDNLFAKDMCILIQRQIALFKFLQSAAERGYFFTDAQTQKMLADLQDYRTNRHKELGVNSQDSKQRQIDLFFIDSFTVDPYACIADISVLRIKDLTSTQDKLSRNHCIISSVILAIKEADHTTPYLCEENPESPPHRRAEFSDLSNISHPNCGWLCSTKESIPLMIHESPSESVVYHPVSQQGQKADYSKGYQLSYFDESLRSLEAPPSRIHLLCNPEFALTLTHCEPTSCFELIQEPDTLTLGRLQKNGKAFIEKYVPKNEVTFVSNHFSRKKDGSIPFLDSLINAIFPNKKIKPRSYCRTNRIAETGHFPSAEQVFSEQYTLDQYEATMRQIGEAEQFVIIDNKNFHNPIPNADGKTYFQALCDKYKPHQLLFVHAETTNGSHLIIADAIADLAKMRPNNYIRQQEVEELQKKIRDLLFPLKLTLNQSKLRERVVEFIQNATDCEALVLYRLLFKSNIPLICVDSPYQRRCIKLSALSKEANTQLEARGAKLEKELLARVAVSAPGANSLFASERVSSGSLAGAIPSPV